MRICLESVLCGYRNGRLRSIPDDRKVPACRYHAACGFSLVFIKKFCICIAPYALPVNTKIITLLSSYSDSRRYFAISEYLIAFGQLRQYMIRIPIRLGAQCKTASIAVSDNQIIATLAETATDTLSLFVAYLSGTIYNALHAVFGFVFFRFFVLHHVILLYAPIKLLHYISK